MAGDQVCAIAAIGGTGGDGRAGSVDDAGRFDPGPFAAVVPIAVPGDIAPAAARAEALREEASRRGAEWILFVAEAERVHPQAFAMAAPAVAGYDALWGGIGIDADGAIEVPKICRYTCDSLPDAAHMALEWWVGRSHFVRTGTAAEVGFSDAAGEAWYADYLMALWRRHRCLKTAQPLTLSTFVPDVGAAKKAFIREQLDSQPLFMTVDYGGRHVKLPYTGLNPTVERVQLRGVYFEQRDLAAVAERLGPRPVVVDVGANTGNHTVFFTAVLAAERVIAFEPNPPAARHLRRAVETNGLTNVDTSQLGVGIGGEAGRMKLDSGRRGHLGTTRLVADAAGDIEVKTLDDTVVGPVDLIKIDVESMELDVLNGARRLIERERPAVLVEVGDANIPAFLALVENLGYGVARVFADEGYANYLIVPAHGAGQGAAEQRVARH